MKFNFGKSGAEFSISVLKFFYLPSHFTYEDTEA